MDLPDPIVPGDTDVRGYQALPLDVTRLLTSETWIMATLAERGAMTSLWSSAWQQVPAGSLPDNDRVLAHLSMAGAEWQAVKEMCLRGWVKCSDGRLYHPVVCEKALEAIAHRKQRTEAAAKRWKKRQNGDGKPAEDAAEHAAEAADEKRPECDRISDSNAVEMHLSSPLLTVTKEAVASLGEAAAPPSEPPPAKPAAVAEPTDRELVWGDGLDWLSAAAGKTPGSLKSMVGRWCSVYGASDVLIAMNDCRSTSPPVVGPIGWIEATLKNRKTANDRHRQPFRPTQRRNGLLELREQELGFGAGNQAGGVAGWDGTSLDLEAAGFRVA